MSKSSKDLPTINGYRLVTPFGTRNSGFAKWAYAVKYAEDYFIKEFLAPVYPADDAPISEAIRTRRRVDCLDWLEDKRQLYRRINETKNGNIVGVTDVFRHNTKHYAVSPKVSVEHIELSQLARMTHDDKLVLMRLLTHVLNQLHDNGVVHADLKPDNILTKRSVNGFITLKLIDFDSSFMIEKPPDHEDLQCDPVYMAPEMFLRTAGFEGDEVAEGVDIFALGIIMHQIYSGTLPVIAPKHRYVYETVLHDSPVELSSVIPTKIAEMLRGMLSKRSGDRPSLSMIFKYYLRMSDEMVEISEAASTSVLSSEKRTEPDVIEVPDVSRIKLSKNFR